LQTAIKFTSPKKVVRNLPCGSFMLCVSASGLDIFTVWFLVEWLYQYDLEQAYFLF